MTDEVVDAAAIGLSFAVPGWLVEVGASEVAVPGAIEAAIEAGWAGLESLQLETARRNGVAPLAVRARVAAPGGEGSVWSRRDTEGGLPGGAAPSGGAITARGPVRDDGLVAEVIAGEAGGGAAGELAAASLAASGGAVSVAPVVGAVTGLGPAAIGGAGVAPVIPVVGASGDGAAGSWGGRGERGERAAMRIEGAGALVPRGSVAPVGGAGVRMRADAAAALRERAAARAGGADGGSGGAVAEAVPFGGLGSVSAAPGGGWGGGADDGGLGTVMGGMSAAPVGGAGQDGGIGRGGEIRLDGHLVGYWLSEAMARDAARPGAGVTGFDPRQAPAWTPSGVL